MKKKLLLALLALLLVLSISNSVLAALTEDQRQQYEWRLSDNGLISTL